MKPLAMFLAVAIGVVAAIASTQAAGEEAKSQITTISGTVSGYEPGRAITVLRPNATTVTYTIDASSTVPTGLAKGRRVVIRTVTRPGADRPLVREVTYSKETKDR